MEFAYDGGGLHWVQIDLGDDDHDHFIDPEERLRVAMARQWTTDQE